ncbi:MAG: glycosyltransferase family 1 protein [Chitinophagaceae bacterium]|nr:glycosyltransferase family 1 protein [Chitinophagaceae bacterium]
MRFGKQMTMKKLFRITTVPMSLDLLLPNQPKFLSTYFDVTLVSSPSDLLEKVAKREGVKFASVKMKRNISVFNDFYSFIKLLRLFLKEKPHIIHFNTPKASLLAAIAGALCKIPNRVYTVSGLRFETESGVQRKLLIFFEKVTCFFASAVIAESSGVLDILKREKIANAKVRFLANGNINGVDLNCWSLSNVSEQQVNFFKTEYNIKCNDFVFLFVGRVVKDKGVKELLSAFTRLSSELQNVKLIIVGNLEETDDEFLSFFKKMTGTYKSIQYVGYSDSVREFMAMSSCLVLPSKREGFPTVILQAGAMTLPVIVSNVNGATDYIREFNGLMIPIEDINALYTAMLQVATGIVKFDSEKMFEFVKQRYSQDIVHKALLNFYIGLN